MLAESPKYTGLRLDEAPRNMGDGFVVLASNVVSIYYYMDEVALLFYITTSILYFASVLRIRDVYPGSRIRIKEFKYLNPKNGF
jgi:hypothetical protein